jgi:ADP-ribose pyrophosphatase
VLHPVISYSTEFIDIWFARGLTLGPRKLDAGEFLDVFTATPAELLAWCASGEVTDAKTLDRRAVAAKRAVGSVGIGLAACPAS